MASQYLVTTHGGHVVGTHSWVDGFTPVAAPQLAMSEDDILARCQYLVQHVSEDAAEEYLELALKKRPRAH